MDVAAIGLTHISYDSMVASEGPASGTGQNKVRSTEAVLDISVKMRLGAEGAVLVGAAVGVGDGEIVWLQVTTRGEQSIN